VNFNWIFLGLSRLKRKKPAVYPLYVILFSCAAFGCMIGRGSDQADEPQGAQSLDNLAQYDNGWMPAVAANVSGLLLEVHRSQSNGALWYHVGQVNGTTVTWGYSQRTGANGNLPSVAMDSNGTVIMVHTGFDNDNLYYQVGKLDPKLGVNQPIKWLTDFGHWDRGRGGSSIAMNDNGVIVGVHQSHTGSMTLYYRVGRLANPSGGDYRIQWLSGDYGVRYANGSSPNIALNNNNQLIEVHEVSPDLLESISGGVNNGAIIWGSSYRFPDSQHYGSSVTLTQSGSLIALYDHEKRLWQRFGQYVGSSTSPGMNWANSEARITNVDTYHPGIANTGKVAVEVHELHEKGTYKLFYSVVQLPGATSNDSSARQIRAMRASSSTKSTDQ
jgi:hypothetical protein